MLYVTCLHAIHTVYYIQHAIYSIQHACAHAHTCTLVLKCVPAGGQASPRNHSQHADTNTHILSTHVHMCMQTRGSTSAGSKAPTQAHLMHVGLADEDGPHLTQRSNVGRVSCRGPLRTQITCAAGGRVRVCIHQVFHGVWHTWSMHTPAPWQVKKGVHVQPLSHSSWHTCASASLSDLLRMNLVVCHPFGHVPPLECKPPLKCVEPLGCKLLAAHEKGRAGCPLVVC